MYTPYVATSVYVESELFQIITDKNGT